MKNPDTELFSRWRSTIEENLRRSRSLCIALFSVSGELLFCNPAMGRLIGESAAESFINPSFAALSGNNSTNHIDPPKTDRDVPVFSGFLTIAGPEGDTSILAKAYRDAECVLVIGEIDVMSLSDQYRAIVELNHDNDTLQRKLLKQKRLLEREVEVRKGSEARVQALLEDKEMILKEVHHRIKNNMSTVIGMLHLQKSLHPNSTTETALSGAADRIHSMMLLYDKLYRSADVNAMPLDQYVIPLLQQVVETFTNGDTVSLFTDVEAVTLRPTLLSQLGMIVNELTTNTMKYAFTDQENRSIVFTASKHDQRLNIEFADNGRGLPDEFLRMTSLGFGMELVSTIVSQMEGTITVDNTAGTRFLIEIPLDDE